MADQGNFLKFRILSLIAASLLLLWYFFDANLSKNVLLRNLGLTDPHILPYLLVALILYFLFESILEYKKRGHEEGWQSRIQLIFIALVSLCSLFISYPKLIIDTLLHETTRGDLIIPIAVAAISAIGAVGFRISIEDSQVFYRLRRTLLPFHWIEMIICGLVILTGISALVFTTLECLPTILSIRYTIFGMSFIFIFLSLTPGKKIYDGRKLAELSKRSECLDRQVELSEYASAKGLKKLKGNKKFHKRAMKTYEQVKRAEDKDLITRFEFLKELKIRTVGSRLEAQFTDGQRQLMEEDERVLRVKIMRKDNGTVLESVDVKSKYFQSALNGMKPPMNERHFKNLLNSVGLKAYHLQLINEGDENQLLFNMAELGELNELKHLMDKRNPNVNYKGHAGWTPLLIAVANGHDEIVKYLLQKAADPNIANKIGMSPLSCAAWYGKEPICKLLLKYGADVNQRDMEGLTPLMRAIFRGHSSIAKYLLENGADPQLSDNHKRTALSYAEGGKHGDVAKLLRKSITNSRNT
jgi:uncharacterized protein